MRRLRLLKRSLSVPENTFTTEVAAYVLATLAARETLALTYRQGHAWRGGAAVKHRGADVAVDELTRARAKRELKELAVVRLQRAI